MTRTNITAWLALAALAVAVVLAVALGGTAKAHNCHAYCDVIYWSNGGVDYCGPVHAGETVFGPEGWALCPVDPNHHYQFEGPYPYWGS